MINGKYSATYPYKGRHLTIDLAELSGREGPVFECIAMYSNGREIELVQVPTLEEGISEYNRMLSKYQESPKPKRKESPEESPGPLTGKYKKLSEDLRQALKAGQAAENAITEIDGQPEDGGTCNLDATAITLPRWHAKKVTQAAKEAGTSCFKWNELGGRPFVFLPNAQGQANARSRNAEAVTAFLLAAGYDALTYCQGD